MDEQLRAIRNGNQIYLEYINGLVMAKIMLAIRIGKKSRNSFLLIVMSRI
jgi:hypothetical protein